MDKVFIVNGIIGFGDCTHTYIFGAYATRELAEDWARRINGEIEELPISFETVKQYDA